ncbi:MAG: hypothetical protein MJ252_00400, partial [archaeon]|nr:hypothetical protein [archaeon]
MESNEEIIINQLVNDIFQAEEKISKITEKTSKDSNISENPKYLELSSSIENLSLEMEVQKNLIKKTKEDKSNVIKNKKENLDSVLQEIEELKSEIIQLNIPSSSQYLSKYFLGNKNIFLTKTQIENFLNDLNKTKTIEDPKTDLKINKIKTQIENSEENKNILMDDLTKLNNEMLINEERLFMLKEDKNTNEEEIFNYVSTKESLFEIIQEFINKFKKNYFEEEDFLLEEINSQLDIYEIVNIDVGKTGQFLSENINDIVECLTNNINNNGLNSPSDNNNGNITFINKSQSISALPKLNQTIESKTIESIDENKMKGLYTSRIIKKDNKIKENLNNAIKEELNNFIKPMKISLYLVKTHPSIQNLISGISNAIINSITYFVNISEIKFKSEDKSIQDYFPLKVLDKFIWLNLTYIWIENILEDKLSFISKEYKQIKKEIQRNLTEKSSNVNKLNTKLEIVSNEISSLNNELKNLEEEKKNKEEEKEQKSIQLNSEEKSYIDLSTKGNILLEKQKEIEAEIKNLNSDLENEEKEGNLKIEGFQKEIEELSKKKEDLKKEIEDQKLKDNTEIIQQRELIANKYSIIKNQLQIHKTKNGNNIKIYNKLLESINDTLKSTQFKNNPREDNLRNINMPLSLDFKNIHNISNDPYNSIQPLTPMNDKLIQNNSISIIPSNSDYFKK